jgi:hypothetical protein
MPARKGPSKRVKKTNHRTTTRRKTPKTKARKR